VAASCIDLNEQEGVIHDGRLAPPGQLVAGHAPYGQIL
jgi:hypothetical protein